MNNTYVIAEIGINHNGSLFYAKKLIDQAFESKCHAVKFQKRDIESVYSQEELERYRESPWGTTNREQKEGLEFSIDQYKELYSYTKNLGMDFIVSCWDRKSIQLIEDNLEVDYHKVASALVTDEEFLKDLVNTGKPIILSTGMSTEEQVDNSVRILSKNLEYILACTSTYPSAIDELNLRYIQTLKDKYPNFKIGFSNHYSGFEASFGAVALGAECIEFHITEDRTAYGSDQAASIQDSKKLVNGIFNMEKMLGDGVKRVYDSELPILNKLRKK
jgi:N-acetylneuraminate synthase